MAVHHFQGDKEGLPRASAYESKVSYLCCRAYPPNGLFVANFENSCSTYLVNKSAYGRQAGKASSAGLSVSLVRPEPSAFIT
jgi:hypothetical protein